MSHTVSPIATFCTTFPLTRYVPPPVIDTPEFSVLPPLAKSSVVPAATEYDAESAIVPCCGAP